MAHGVSLLVIAPDGQAVSVDASAEVNDTDGGATTDCAFGATAVG